ncbi:MAG: ribonucleoside-triphosphate reductase, adenosylcobalamin-dependent, partial [Okeania sp. SIO4D6]|nr:ribonucleoside-triphosphate reductase, adenosylcobalamin-dependent [Okeania sp. SIO4D6]
FHTRHSSDLKTKKLEYLIHQYKRPIYSDRFVATVESFTYEGVEKVYDCTVPAVSRFDGNGLVVHNCGEILGSNYHCDLSEVHLNMINPDNLNEQIDAFNAGAINVAGLLHQQFTQHRYQLSRELDPIIAVSFTGLFDFFVNAFGIEWLKWWMEGRDDKWMSDNHEQILVQLLSLSISDIQYPPEQKDIIYTSELFKYYEKLYLSFWKSIVEKKVIQYCDKHNLKIPNRYTCVQPAGTKSLLTNASPGWHPPFGIHYVRRITYRKNDAVAKACLDYGYSVIPGQSDKNSEGTLLNNPFDDRVTEWLVEIPVSVSWSNIEGIETIDLSKIKATAMFDFYMGIQEHWTTHNTSSTILLTKDEIIPLATKIFEAIQEDKGYISSALLARFDAPFPRLPFEKISKDEYNKMNSEIEQRRNNNKTFQELVNYYIENTETIPESACEGMSCILK